jgi:tetratricopeptide (TPR) repeat protein
VGNTLVATQGRAVRASCLLELGDADAAEAVADELVEAVEQSGTPDAMYQASCLRSNLACLRGRFDDAERHGQEAFATMPNAMLRRIGLSATMYNVRRAQGRLGEVVDMLEQTVAGSPHLSGYRYVLAHAYAETGRTDDARRELAAHGDGARLRRDIQWQLAASSLGEACALLGDAERAARLYPLLEPFASHCVTGSQVICTGSFARLLGQLAATLGDHDRAATHFERALEIHRRMRAAPWVADTQYWYARTLITQGNRDRAAGQVAEALEIAESLGMARKLEQLRELQTDLASAQAGA